MRKVSRDQRGNQRPQLPIEKGQIIVVKIIHRQLKNDEQELITTNRG